MFERAHHRNVALVLQALDPAVLSERHCYFGGGTAMVLQRGEYRLSVDIDFVVSDIQGYRDLRQMLTGPAGLGPLARPGLRLELDREVRADQYGIRTRVVAGASAIKFEIFLEGRVELSRPGPDDLVCGVQTLAGIDMAAEKLLANADRWRDDSVYSRDIIDLAMMAAPKALLHAACGKAEQAYGESVRESVASAARMLRANPRRLDECIRALQVQSVTKAQLWAAIRRLGSLLPEPGPPAEAR